MGRRKIEIKAIKDDRNRSVGGPVDSVHSTFLKRKGGLFKKAHELSVLCSVDVAVIIFGHNKKLYEFSSGDIRETLGKYQYYGPPHEHKGPGDFAGKTTGDDDDDDDMSPGPEDLQNPGVVPPHLQNQPSFQHINHAPSASPPLSNGVSFDPRHGTPQPQGLSRPSSRSHTRRLSANLVSQQSHPQSQSHPHPHATPPPPPQNGFAYMPNPSIYNPNANPNLSQQASRSGQFQQFTHPPPGPQHATSQSHPPSSIPQHHHQPPPHHLSQQAPHHGLPSHQSHQHPHPHPTHQQMPHVYLSEQGRHSMPPTFPPEQQPPPPPPPPQQQQQQQQQQQHPHSHQQRPMTHPEPPSSQPAQLKTDEGQSSPPPNPPPSKSRSIFTPIDDQGSVLARHFEIVPRRESAQGDPSVKLEPHLGGSGPAVSTSSAAPPKIVNRPSRAVTDPQRPQSVSSLQDIPLSRTNSLQVNAKRPRLTVHIPSDQSDGGSATADSSPHGTPENKTATPSKMPSDANPVVLPPPSPSAGPMVSAGAQGPPNPFARPPPPGSNSQNGAGYGGSNSMDTPISALPSRFVSDALLPSPSSFFPEWGFGRSGPDTNMLPSPLTFPTPSVQTGPSFQREDELDRKRKSPEGGALSELAGTSKKLKT
ncbi:hypothetical protein V8E54_007862 [Elaphomyces granulatus]